MTWEMVLVFAVLGVTVFLFLSEWLRVLSIDDAYRAAWTTSAKRDAGAGESGIMPMS